jgi:hypothetical protein
VGLKDTRGARAPRDNAKILPGGPVGSRHRQQLNGEFIAALLRDFRHGGPAAIAKVRKNQPAAYCKLLTLLCPRDVKVEHSGGVKAMSDEQLEAAIEAIQAMLEQQAKVIEGTAETVALAAPDVVPDGPNKVMDAADTAVGARERKPRKRKAPSPTGG